MIIDCSGILNEQDDDDILGSGVNDDPITNVLDFRTQDLKSLKI